MIQEKDLTPCLKYLLLFFKVSFGGVHLDYADARVLTLFLVSFLK
jgi:hypothetical protein